MRGYSKAWNSHETLQQGVERRGYQEEGCEWKKKHMKGMILRMRLIMIKLLVTGSMGGDLENQGIGKIIIWVVLR